MPGLLEDARGSSGDLRAAVGEIRRAAQNAADALAEVNQLVASSRRDLGPESAVQYEMLRALQELSQASKMALRLSVGARVTQLPSGSMPTISECACWLIWRTRVLR